MTVPDDNIALDPAGKKVSVFNIANAITLVRLFLGVAVVFLLAGNHKALSILLYLVFLILDLVDGMAARRWKCASNFGYHFDVVTDGGIGFVLAAALVLKGHVPAPYVVLAVPPLVVFAVATWEGATISKNPFIPAKWRTVNGQVMFLILLLFMLHYRWSVIVAYLLLVYVYISRTKHLVEVLQLKRKLSR